VTSTSDVAGVGPISLPRFPAGARRLCGIAHSARYGLRDQTLLDRNVRDARKIGKRRVKIDEKRWRRTLDPACRASTLHWQRQDNVSKRGAVHRTRKDVGIVGCQLPRETDRYGACR
jgi:hypothetical protein